MERNKVPLRSYYCEIFISLLCYRLLEKKLGNNYTCRAILDTLKDMNFAQIEDQGFMPVYTRSKLTDDLHKSCGFRTDYQFITKSAMKTIQKESKGK